MLIRIEKYLSEQGIMSRREAKKYLLEGLIEINNKKPQPGDKINPEKDKITYAKSIQKNLSEKITVAVYKPRGILSSKDTDKGKNIFQSFPQFKDLNTVGRLDKESEGLILLSNDGMITKAVTGKDHNIEKEYVVTVRENYLPWMAKKMSQGMKLQDGWTLPARASRVDEHTFKIILKEGRKHQIRRMANECKLTVTSLKRIRVHTIKIDGMLPGNFKKLTVDEISDIKKVGKVKNSS
ncbi:MAG: pseudouridine synthase [Candidatus Pacebacteria bacterium]|nr:pseudouridine synthase [Candidatus Paceibacterota bacterium]